MTRFAAIALTSIAACALKTEPEQQTSLILPGDDNVRALGQTGKAMSGSDGVFQFSAEVAAAEAAALKAREEAAEAIAAEGANARVSQRQLEAEDRRAESQFMREVKTESMIERVVDQTAHEVDAEDQAVEDMERRLKVMEGQVRRDSDGWQKFQADNPLNDGRGVWVDDRNNEPLKREQKAERQIDQELAREEGNEAKLMVHARKQVESALFKERAYLHMRPKMERETQGRLAQEAEILRKTAIENGTISEDETAQLLDMTKHDLDNITIKLDALAKNKSKDMTAVWIEEKLDGSRSKVSAASAKMLEAIKHMVKTFKDRHTDYDDHQFLGLLSRVLNDTMAEVKIFENTRDYQMTRLDNWDKSNGEKLTSSLANAIQGVTGSLEFRSRLTQIDPARLASMQTNEACFYLTNLVNTAMAPAYQSLAHQKATLDDMSKIVPSVTSKYPAFVQESIGARAAALLDMAYMENLALKEVATNIVQEAAPVVMSRLRCAMSGAARSGLAAAAFVAAAAWLAQ